MAYLYRADFRLNDKVEDYEAARKSLVENNMTPILLEDNCSNGCKEKLMHVEWVFTDNDKGYIDLVASEELNEEQLSNISSWISVQETKNYDFGKVVIVDESTLKETYSTYQTKFEITVYSIAENIDRMEFMYSRNDYEVRLINEKEHVEAIFNDICKGKISEYIDEANKYIKNCMESLNLLNEEPVNLSSSYDLKACINYAEFVVNNMPKVEEYFKSKNISK